jgi:hypothetical protein
MDHQPLRLLIQQKLADGRLPRQRVPRFRSGASKGEACNACDEVIAGRQLWIEGIALAGGGRRDLRLHVQCLYLWDDERDRRWP